MRIRGNLKQKSGVIVCAAAVLSMLFLSLAISVKAADQYAYKLNGDKLITVVNDKSELSGTYAFTPRVNSKTVVTAGGSALKGTNDSAAMSNCSKTDILSKPCFIFAGTSDKAFSDCWIKYANVGTWYDNTDTPHIVDIKVTVNSVSFAKTDDGNNFPFSFAAEKGSIGILMSRYGRIKMTLTFYEHGTNKKLNLSGHFNIGDVDVNQGVLMYKNNVEQYYVYDDSGSKLKVNTAGYSSGYVFYADTNTNFTNGLKKAMVMEAFSGSEVSFYYYGKYRPGTSGTAKAVKSAFQEIYGNVTDSKWQHFYDLCKSAYDAKDYTGYNYQDSNSKYDGGMFMNTFFELSADAPMAQSMPDPVKTISVEAPDFAGNNVSSVWEDLNTALLGKTDHQFYYNIYQYVPYERLTEFHYDNLEITDTLRDFLQTDNGQCSVYNENGTDVTKYFNVDVQENQVAFQAKPEYLKKNSFYGHGYKFRIKCSVKDLESLKNSKEKQVSSETADNGIVTDTYSWGNTALRHMERFGNDSDMETNDVTVKAAHKIVDSTVILQKVSEKVFSETEEAVMGGVKFHVWREDQTFDEILKTDDSGKIILSDLTPGRYFYQETETLPGYLKDDTVREFLVDDEGLIQGKVKETFTIRNTPVQIQIRKLDAATGQSLAGAHLKLVDSSDRTYLTFVSQKNPKQVSRIPAGIYTLIETKAPQGYALADPVTIKIEEKPGIQDFELKDIPYGNLTIVKKVKYSEITFAHGNPVFRFTVNGKDLAGKFHEYGTVLEFTDDLKPDGSGFVTVSHTFSSIPAGTAYQVLESSSLRYRLKNVSSLYNNVSIQKLKEGIYGDRPSELFETTVNLQQKLKGTSVTFENVKCIWDDYTHTDMINNTIAVK